MDYDMMIKSIDSNVFFGEVLRHFVLFPLRPKPTLVDPSRLRVPKDPSEYTDVSRSSRNSDLVDSVRVYRRLHGTM